MAALSCMGCIALLVLSCPSLAQQIADVQYSPEIGHLEYPPGKGPRVGIDEGHHNFHTASGRYSPFAALLRRDGYVVSAFPYAISSKALRQIDILVIANALGAANKEEKNWWLPRESAFSKREIDGLVAWVRNGGRLLLIADHAPFPGAVDKLARAFGIRFSDGFVYEQRDYTPPDIFMRSNGTLRGHAITDGRNSSERVDSVATFTGSAFQAGSDAAPLLVLGPKYVSSSPRNAESVFDKDTPRISVAGWLQGAAIHFGAGRLAVFGEAGMFTAQLAGEKRIPMGMNHPDAGQNYRLLLNVLHWLSIDYHPSK